MEIQEIIFNIISDSPQLWVRYWIQEKASGLCFPGEYIELRSGYIWSKHLEGLFGAGFKIETIKTQKINADVYSDVLLKRKLQ